MADGSASDDDVILVETPGLYEVCQSKEEKSRREYIGNMLWWRRVFETTRKNRLALAEHDLGNNGLPDPDRLRLMMKGLNVAYTVKGLLKYNGASACSADVTQIDSTDEEEDDDKVYELTRPPPLSTSIKDSQATSRGDVNIVTEDQSRSPVQKRRRKRKTQFVAIVAKTILLNESDSPNVATPRGPTTGVSVLSEADVRGGVEWDEVLGSGQSGDVASMLSRTLRCHQCLCRFGSVGLPIKVARCGHLVCDNCLMAIEKTYRLCLICKKQIRPSTSYKMYL